MESLSHSHTEKPQKPRHSHPCDLQHGFWRQWFLANSLISGVLAVCWLLLRSGTKPSRFAYPCQQAAISTATLAFAGPLVAAVIAARRRVAAGLRTPAGIAAAGLGLLLTTGLWGYFSWADEYRGPKPDPPRGYRADLYHVTDCPEDPTADRFVGLDNLIALMGHEGLKFYQSSTESLVTGPNGIIATDFDRLNGYWATATSSSSKSTTNGTKGAAPTLTCCAA